MADDKNPIWRKQVDLYHAIQKDKKDWDQGWKEVYEKGGLDPELYVSSVITKKAADEAVSLEQALSIQLRFIQEEAGPKFALQRALDEGLEKKVKDAPTAEMAKKEYQKAIRAAGQAISEYTADKQENYSEQLKAYAKKDAKPEEAKEKAEEKAEEEAAKE